MLARARQARYTDRPEIPETCINYLGARPAIAIDKNLAVLLKSSRIGEDEPDLGEKLLRTFLSVLLESDRLPHRIICLNSAIFLTTTASPVEETLKKFEAGGTEVLSCKTCLDYYSRADDLIVGQPTDMKVTVTTLLNCQVITF